MTYALFLVKQLFKNVLSYIPLGIILVACLGMLYLNHQAADNDFGLLQQAKTNLQMAKGSLETYKQELATLEEGTEKYHYTQKNIAMAENTIKSQEGLIKSFESGDWKAVYQHKLNNLAFFDSPDTAPADEILAEAIKRDKLFYQALLELELPYEEPHVPYTATHFTLSLFQYVLPVLLPIGLAYVLSNLYGSAYAGQLDKNRLLPQSLWSITLKNIFVGSFYSLLTLLAILLPVVLVSGLIYGWGNPDYPILFYDLTTKDMYFSAIGSVILPTILLHGLSLIFMTVLIYLITILTKNKMTALFISTLVLLAGVALPSFLAPASAIAHLIPTTYIASFDITTGVFQNHIENYQVNTTLGLIVLLVSIALVTLACLLAQKPRKTFS